ncbi:Prefoldin subunit 6 [Bonamia ostreae]|uniref:Prefoldin subunit 6 n=1 Tax=Bonamia ostreae TaxID=126728 RepID=A0ABV2AMR6_9EUKA
MATKQNKLIKKYDEILQQKLVLKNQEESINEYEHIISENKLAMREIKLNKHKAIYKQYGAVLVKQDEDVSVENLEKRINFIETEMKKLVTKINENVNKTKILERDFSEFRANLASGSKLNSADKNEI